MRSYRGLMIGLGAVLLLGVIGVIAGWVWLNTFIHSDAFRHQVEVQASQASGGTIEIKQINWSIWSGVKVDGAAAKVVVPHGTIVMQVENLSCSYSLLALLERKVQLKSLTLSKPQIVLTQADPRHAGLPVPVAADAEASPAGKTAPFELTLKTANIVDGTLSIQDAAGATKAELQGVEMTADTSGYFRGEDVTGKLTVATVGLPENLKITDFSTTFTANKDTYTEPSFQATAFGGQITGDYKLDPSGPSLLEANATQIDMSQVGLAAAPEMTTRLSGSMAIQSKWTGAETGKLTGQGDVQITNGVLSGVALLHELADAFKLKEMSDPEIKSVTTHFEVAAGTTRFSNLQIESTLFEMSGSGVIDPKGNLSADMTLTLHADAFARIPSIADSFFTKLPDGGASIPFHLSGTVENPQSDATTKMFIQGSKINKTIQKTINNIFH